MKKLFLLIVISGLFVDNSKAQSLSEYGHQSIHENRILKSKNLNFLVTDYGVIMLGPQNPSFAHIYTDRPRFIFNRDVYSYYGGFSAYSNFNLSLKTNGTTRMLIKKKNGYVGIGTTNPRAKLDVNGNALVQNDLKVYQNFEVDGQVKFNNVAYNTNVENPLLTIHSAEIFNIQLNLPNSLLKCEVLDISANVVMPKIKLYNDNVVPWGYPEYNFYLFQLPVE